MIKRRKKIEKLDEEGKCGRRRIESQREGIDASGMKRRTK